jgi:hypothetical protein
MYTYIYIYIYIYIGQLEEDVTIIADSSMKRLKQPFFSRLYNSLNIFPVWSSKSVKGKKIIYFYIFCCTDVYIWVYIHACRCVHIRIYVHTFTYIGMHIYIHV